MTEKQGGSDVRANVTTAPPTADRRPVHPPRPQVVHLGADERRLPGARPGAGRPDLLPDAARPARRHPQHLRRRPTQGQARQPIQRFRRARVRRHPRAAASATRGAAYAPSSRWWPRLGSTASSGSASLMRHALAEATWHAAHRSAFGGLLADKPLMRNVLADLALESEAATALAMRLAAAVDAPDDPHEAALRRIALPLAKFWVCKRTPAMVAEALGVPGRQRLRRGVGAAADVSRERRSTPSGRARATSTHSTCCARWRASPSRWRPGCSRSARPAGPTVTWTGPWTRPSACSGDSLGARSRCASARRRGWPPACRVHCWCSTPRPRSPTLFCASRLAAEHHGAFGMLDGGEQAYVVERATPFV